MGDLQAPVWQPVTDVPAQVLSEARPVGLRGLEPTWFQTRQRLESRSVQEFNLRLPAGGRSKPGSSSACASSIAG